MGSYVDKINKNDELARYEKGKLTAEVLALFIGVEEASAAKKIAEFERFLARAATQDIEKVGAKVAERTVIAESKIVSGAGSWLNKIDDLGLTALRNEVNLLNDATKTKFLAEFADASDDALRALNNNTSLLNYWKTNGNFIKGKNYPNVGHKAWSETSSSILAKADPTEMKILNAVDNATPPTNSQVAVAGAYSPELPSSSVSIRYNDKNFNVSSLEPELKQHLDYIKMIKDDFDKGGKLYEKLYSNVPLEKIQNAGLAGTHAEVLATNEVIKQLKLAGKFNGIQDLNKIQVLVKGRASFGNMCRCPHCFQILDGVKMIGNQ